MIKTIWKSESTSPVNNEPFLTVKESRGYYLFSERAGKDSIAFILGDMSNEEKFGLIYESKPPLDTANKKAMGISAFGGSMDDYSKTPIQICKMEVLEEAGYEVDNNRIKYVGSTMVSTQSNQICHLYFVDVSNLVPGKTEADIFNEEQNKKDPDEFCHNEVRWLTLNEVLENAEWKSVYILSQIKLKPNKNKGIL